MSDSPELVALLASGQPVPGHAPWPRVLVDPRGWQALAACLQAEAVDLLAYWGEPGTVHAAVRSRAGDAVAVVSHACDAAGFASLAAAHPAAIRPERAIFDLHGLRAQGAPDTRPWLDHGRWARPPVPGTGPASEAASGYAFLASEGEGLHQIAVGPVHAGVIEPGHFRFTVNGETVVRLEQRLGYVHRGVEQLMAGAPLARATRLAERVSGDSTVAYAIAFARAVEAASGTEPPARADWLRALMAELERMANHLGDIGAICNDAAFTLMHAHCGVLRERVLRAAAACFGHRLMRDCVLPGGVARDLSAADVARVRDLCREIGQRLPSLAALYDGTTSLQDRTVATGHVSPDLARRFAAGGYVGRASGRDFDARRRPGYPPYAVLDFDVPVLREGDVNARVWIRIREVEQSLVLLEQMLTSMPDGECRASVRPGAGEGMALVEGFRGDVLAWVRLGADGEVARAHLRDPSWFQWPLLEAAIEGNIVADFPLCNKSFNCSYAGHDL